LVEGYESVYVLVGEVL